MLSTLKAWATALKLEVMAVYLASRDPRTPRIAKVVAITVAAYALSPIDLIPDFIPVVGYLDDLIIVPLGLTLAIRLIPPDVLADARQKTIAASAGPTNYLAAATFIAIWISLGVATFVWWRTRA